MEERYINPFGWDKVKRTPKPKILTDVSALPDGEFTAKDLAAKYHVAYKTALNRVYELHKQGVIEKVRESAPNGSGGVSAVWRKK